MQLVNKSVSQSVRCYRMSSWIIILNLLPGSDHPACFRE